MPSQRHHYVPQFYLRNFAKDADQRQVGVFVRNRNLYIPSASIRTQAQREQFYRSKAREEAFCVLEGQWAQILRNCIETGQLPARYSDEYHSLLLFVIMQALRTPTAVDAVEQSWNRLASEMREIDSRLVPPGKGAVDPLLTSLQLATAVQVIAMDLGYKILVNDTEVEYCTSDNPVLLYNQVLERRAHPGGITGWACRGLQVFVPLSPRATLMLFDTNSYRVGSRKLRTKRVILNADDVRRLNELQMANCESQVFFSRLAVGEVLRTARIVASWPQRQWRAQTYRRPDDAEGKKHFLIWSHKEDLRTKLELSVVDELPSSLNRPLVRTMAQVRDPLLCQLQSEYLTHTRHASMNISAFTEFVRGRMEVLRSAAMRSSAVAP